MSYFRLKLGDMRNVLKRLPDNYVHSVVCDPPYHLTSSKNAKVGFMDRTRAKESESKMSYLAFVDASPNKKTLVWNVVSTYGVQPGEASVWLGEIKWFGRFRKYCFFPAKTSVFDEKCLADIQQFLSTIKKVRVQS